MTQEIFMDNNTLDRMDKVMDHFNANKENDSEVSSSDLMLGILIPVLSESSEEERLDDVA
jgi:hypothetical protein